MTNQSCKDGVPTICYQPGHSPWISEDGREKRFGKLTDDTRAHLPKCEAEINSVCDKVAQATVVVNDKICIACAHAHGMALTGVYCRFCYQYTEANIPWSASPFFYVCAPCAEACKKANPWRP
jgi:hypothetical protein